MSAPTQDDDNALAVMIAAVAASGTLLGAAGALWLNGMEWLVTHQVLVAAAESPLLAIPHAQGVGLDWPRLLVLAGLALALAAWAASAARRVYKRRQELR